MNYIGFFFSKTLVHDIKGLFGVTKRGDKYVLRLYEQSHDTLPRGPTRMRPAHDYVAAITDDRLARA